MAGGEERGEIPSVGGSRLAQDVSATVDQSNSMKMKNGADQTCAIFFAGNQARKGAFCSLMLEIVININVGGFYKVFNEANYLFQFISLN